MPENNLLNRGWPFFVGLRGDESLDDDDVFTLAEPSVYEKACQPQVDHDATCGVRTMISTRLPLGGMITYVSPRLGAGMTTSLAVES